MSVQGTSSEFYPRRNYKIKTKTELPSVNDPEGSKKTHIFLHKGPFAADYLADSYGVNAKKYIISTGLYKENEKYYEDANGENEVIISATNPYEPNKYYMKNPAYVEFGKEKTRQDFWYMDNNTVGTTKFTMKIDYMESSGSYNMGFANLAKKCYSKHPLDDYNAAGAFEVVDPSSTSRAIATNYDSASDKQYFYMTHKGAWKIANTPGVNNNNDEGFTINNESDFNKTPLELWIEQKGTEGTIKILITQEMADAYNATHDGATIKSNVSKAISETANSAEPLTEALCAQYAGHWFEASLGYKKFIVKNTNDYRTSV